MYNTSTLGKLMTDNSMNLTGKFGDLSSIMLPSEFESNLTCSTSTLVNNKSNLSAKVGNKEKNSCSSFDDEDERLCEDLSNLDFESVKLSSQ